MSLTQIRRVARAARRRPVIPVTNVSAWAGPATATTLGGPATVNPVALTDATDITIGGRQYRVQSPDLAHSFASDTDPTPTYSRFEIRGGEQWANDVANFGDGRQRCELRDLDDFTANVDWWMAGSVRVTTNSWKNSASGYNIITQYHQDSLGSPPLALDITQGTFTIRTRGNTATPVVQADPIDRYTQTWTHNGQWVHFVIQSRFSTATANGLLNVWMNGAPVVNLTNIALGYNSTNGRYQKHGMYRSGHTDTVVVEWANREFGTANLTSRITSPLPVPA